MAYAIKLTLRSDATFGRGDGVIGLVDAEVEYEAGTGLPYLRARALKGLLVEECTEILGALPAALPGTRRLEAIASELFGQAGSVSDSMARLRIGAAQLPVELRQAVAADVRAGRMSTNETLNALTAIRRQTAMIDDGVPDAGSLRAMRVLLRETILTAPVEVEADTDDQRNDMLALLAACVAALRRGGSGRNRGRGRLRGELIGEPAGAFLERFERIVRGTEGDK